MEHFKIIDELGNPHLVFIGWNRLLANDRQGIFVHCVTRSLGTPFFHEIKTFSDALQEIFGNDQLIKVK